MLQQAREVDRWKDDESLSTQGSHRKQDRQSRGIRSSCHSGAQDQGEAAGMNERASLAIHVEIRMIAGEPHIADHDNRNCNHTNNYGIDRCHAAILRGRRSLKRSGQSFDKMFESCTVAKRNAA